MEDDFQIEALTEEEISNLQILLVEPDPVIARPLEATLRELQPGRLEILSDHLKALQRLREENYSHLLFSTTVTSADASEFLAAAITAHPEIVALPTSQHPDVDQIFDLLMIGARAYITLPISLDSLNRVIAIATRTDSIPEAISSKNDKFKTLSNMLFNCVDEIAKALTEAKDNGKENKDLPRLMAKFRDAADMARAFTSGSEMELLESLQEVCILRASRRDGLSPIDQLRLRVDAIKKVRSSLG